MINKTIENVKKSQEILVKFFETTSNFVVHANFKLKEVNISVLKSFPIIRFSRSAPEGITEQKNNFVFSYHNVVTNAVTNAVLSNMRARFLSHEKLYKQISCFNQNWLSEILASSQNVKLSLIANAVPEIDRVVLQGELVSFALGYKDLKKGLLENMNGNENNSDRLESEKECTEVAELSEKTTCKNCFSCGFTLL